MRPLRPPPPAVLGAAPVVPLAQAPSEGLALTVAALIAVAVLTVLARLLVVLLRQEPEIEPRTTTRPSETSVDDRPLPGSSGESGAVDPGRVDDAESGGAAHDRAPRRDRPAPRRPVVRPPQPQERWTATIGWATDDARFRVLARRDDEPEADHVVLAQTEVLPWPPTDDASVQALTDASAVLESVLLDSGWTSLPGGDAWYAKRFAWGPRSVAGRRAGSGRFERPAAGVPDPVSHDGEPRGR